MSAVKLDTANEDLTNDRLFLFPSRLEMVATVVEVLIGKRGGVGWGGDAVSS